MKLIYKLFMFSLILRLMPAVIGVMGIFPNTALSGIGYSFDADDDAFTILTKIVSPEAKNSGIGIPGTGIQISIQFTLTAILAALAIVAILKSPVIPVVVASVTAVLIIPMIVNMGYLLVNSAKNEYHSDSLSLMVLSLIVAAIALGVLTLLDFAMNNQDVSDT